MATLELRQAGITEQSPKKATNDDYLLSLPDRKAYVICDGVSGHAGGNVASKLAAESALKYLREKLTAGAPASLTEAGTWARDAVLHASKAVFDKAAADPKLAKMATTFDLLWLHGNRLISAHTGDGRVYLHRPGAALTRITRDHTYVQDLIESGQMTEEQAKKSPYAHTLVHAVGIAESARVDLLAPEIQAGDLIFACTDGIYGGCPEPQLATALARAPGNGAAVLAELVKTARAGGSHDDATAMILEVVPAAAGAAPSASGGAPGAAKPAIELEQTQGVAAPAPQVKIQALDLSPCFGQLSFAEKTRLLDLAKPVTVKPGQILAREGEVADQFWVMLSGTIKITEKDTVLGERTGAMTLGEAALMEREPRSATVTAVTELQLLEFERAKVLAFLEPHMRNPAAQIFRAIAQLEHHRMRDLSKQLSALRSK